MKKETNHRDELFRTFDEIQTKLLQDKRLSCLLIYKDCENQADIECHLIVSDDNQDLADLIITLNDVQKIILTSVLNNILDDLEN